MFGVFIKVVGVNLQSTPLLSKPFWMVRWDKQNPKAKSKNFAVEN